MTTGYQRAYQSNRRRLFQIRYYRDRYWTERYERAGLYKPEGYVTSHADPIPEDEARKVASHINSFDPTYPCLVVQVA